MNISTSSDYAVRALLYLADRGQAQPNGVAVRVSTKEISEAGDISPKYLETLLRKLRQAGLIESHRGPSGGHQLAKSPTEISIADVIRAIDGPLAEVRGERPESINYFGPAKHLTKVWIAVRSSLREILEDVTIAQVLTGDFSNQVLERIDQPDAWVRRKR